MSFQHLMAAVLALGLAAHAAAAAPCPPTGGALSIEVLPPPQTGPSSMILSGARVETACDTSESLSVSYSIEVECDGSEACTFAATGLAPGLWVHRIVVSSGESLGQVQARRGVVLDATAGNTPVRWPLFRSVATVVNNDDTLECEGCLRRAIERSAAADKPTLIVFSADVAGNITLVDQLPELSAAGITLDAVDFDGRPHRRTIDANGLSHAALRITGSDNHVIGIRITNVGGDSDMLLIDGLGADRNVLESIQIEGRANRLCELSGEVGCLVGNRCTIPNRLAPRGDCGDDGVAVRDDAGRGGANLLVDLDVSGAFDKGVKVSDGGVAELRRSHIHGNADGGIQATLGGTLSAIENRSEDNRGTLGANGLAANGPRIGMEEPARLTTRGNLLRDNALRGLSVRSLSVASIRDDFICGNGTLGTEVGFGLAMLDAAGFSAAAEVRGTAIVHNLDGGVFTMGASVPDLGTWDSPGSNAFGFNGVDSSLDGPTQLRHTAPSTIQAVGNQWEQCGPTYECNEISVLIGAILAEDGDVEIVPSRATPQRRAPIIHEIRPSHARAGELVWIYGENFDAIGAAAQDPECDGAGRPCRTSDPNCVFIGNDTAEIVAATPTLLVVRAPFDCVAPVKLAARTRQSRGFGRSKFCTMESDL